MNKGKEVATKALSGEYDKQPDMKSMQTHEIHTRRGHEGGYIARHDLKDKNGIHHNDHPEYPIADIEALKKHIEQHLGDNGTAAAAQAPEVAREDLE